ncbi:6-bladed beta-propeller [Salinibacter altiplanensis]|uniref:6-bladed beta-propeller n=1 Tax=Salinibacter altiplanensis TaxID=1803181 RepID=UPI000C9FDD61|nr:6-bladed beta-propeller [Salinibacter altiplanensis]
MSSFPSKGVLFLALVVLLGAGCQSSSSDAPAYQFVETWEGPGSEAEQFQNPIGIAVSGGEVLVSEAGNRRIQVFGRKGEVLRQIGPAIGDGDTLRRPMHIAAGDSMLYVPDFNTDRIHALSLGGDVQRSLGRSGVQDGFDAPGGVAVDASGRLYVADFYNHRVLRFGPGGTVDRQWGTADSSGKAPNRFTYPTDVAALPGGGFVVADAYNHRIKRYNSDGSLAWMRPKDQNWADSTKGTFNVATAVTAGPGGTIYVADFYNHRIQVFSPEGEYRAAFGEQGTGEGQFERPVDVAVGAEGILHVVDFGNDRIQRFRGSN